MKQFFKSNIFITTVMVLVWLSMEAVFYEIASDAQKAYEKNLLNQAVFHVQDVEKNRELNKKLGGVYVFKEALANTPYTTRESLDTQKGALTRLSPTSMAHMLSKASKSDFLHYALVSNNPIKKTNKAEGFYKKALQELEVTKSKKALFKIDKKTKRFHYIEPMYVTQSCLSCHFEQERELGDLRGGILIDMDAAFTVDRIDKVWYSFYFVSILTTFFMLLALFFILNMSRQKFHYFSQNILLEENLSEKVKKLNQVLKASQIGYWEWNIQTDEHNVDEQWLKILGLSRRFLSRHATDWSERIHPDDQPKVMEAVQDAIKTQGSYLVEFRMRHEDGRYVWIQGSGGVTQIDEKGEVLKLSGTHQDITRRKLLEIERQNSAAYLNTLFERNPNIIIVSDGERIIKANDAFFQFFDEYASLEAFQNEHKCICEFFVHSEDDEFVTNKHGVWMEEVLESSEPMAKIRYKEKEYCFAVHAKKVKEHKKVSVIVTFNNITETYGLKKRFEELSTVDELTKAYNRRCFNTVFVQETNRAIREQHSFCLAILDIDNFKLYNDNNGHDEGDEVLAHFSQEVQKTAQRSNEFFFRLGGEEFGLIFSNKTQEEALAYAQVICKSVEELGIEHEENLPWKKFTVSIGVAYMSPAKELDLKAIYKKADEALYKAKDNGRNCVEIIVS